METRANIACDQCHGHKLKCTPLSQGCVRCTRLAIRCTFTRLPKKRGRKSTRSRPSPALMRHAPDYPVLDCLNGLSVLSHEKEETESTTIRPTRYEASRLLEHSYESPNQEFHTRLIRRSRLLDLESPRSTSPTLLLSILCVSCFMPTAKKRADSTRRMAQGRYFFDQLNRHFYPRTFPGTNHVFDDALTAFMLTTIAPSEKSLESGLQYWLVFLNFVVQKLDLHKDDQGMDEDDREERRRLWWATYIIDRHAALSFNGRPRLTDQECSSLPTPCPDAIWDYPAPLPRSENRPPQSMVWRYQVHSLDMLGTFLPLSRILGDILEYRFLDDHPTFNTNRALLETSRTTIIQNLQLWFDSFETLVKPDFCRIAEPECELLPGGSNPAVAYYGLHMYHCMFVLLHGRMDVVRMYHDLEWQASPDFLKAGEHAVACANVARHILRIDPRLSFMYRYFGTYFLQSSFIFLILAQKLGQQSDSLILRNCAINLQVLDKFVLATNMDYQRTFAELLRKALSHNMERSSHDQGHTYHDRTSPLEEVESHLDPEMLRYRWTPGFTGLWAHTKP